MERRSRSNRVPKGGLITEALEPLEIVRAQEIADKFPTHSVGDQVRCKPG